jgi:hypothetical protein
LPHHQAVRILRDEISEENLAIVQRFADTVNQQDLAGFLALVDPEVEFHTFRGVEPGLDVARCFAEGGAPQEHYLTQVVREQAFDAGDRVLVFANIQRRWRKTGELGTRRGWACSSPSDRARSCASKSSVTASKRSKLPSSASEDKHPLCGRVRADQGDGRAWSSCPGSGSSCWRSVP